MTDSKITYSRGAVMLEGPDATRLAHVVALRGYIGLLSSGIGVRGLSLTKALRMATKYTGQTYRRTEVERARADLLVWCETMKSSIPVEVKS